MHRSTTTLKFTYELKSTTPEELILRSGEQGCVQALLESYARRFAEEFMAGGRRRKTHGPNHWPPLPVKRPASDEKL
jgi:hypothetical protein